jgi:hypothetical protein
MQPLIYSTIRLNHVGAEQPTGVSIAAVISRTRTLKAYLLQVQ